MPYLSQSSHMRRAGAIIGKVSVFPFTAVLHTLDMGKRDKTRKREKRKARNREFYIGSLHARAWSMAKSLLAIIPTFMKEGIIVFSLS
jgi:hypothetical protein